MGGCGSRDRLRSEERQSQLYVQGLVRSGALSMQLQALGGGCKSTAEVASQLKLIHAQALQCQLPCSDKCQADGPNPSWYRQICAGAQLMLAVPLRAGAWKVTDDLQCHSYHMQSGGIPLVCAILDMGA